MVNTDLFHRVAWTPAALSQKPLSFTKVVFFAPDRESENESLSAYRSQLASEGYVTEVVRNHVDITPLLTPETEAIIVHIPHVARDRSTESVYEAVVDSCTSLAAASQVLQRTELNHVKLFSLAAKNGNASELSHAPLSGLARVLKMEIPEIFGGLFETEARADWFPLSAIQYAQGFDVIRVCEEGGVPQAASLQPLSQNEGDDSIGPLRLDSESTYLITGGTRGIGLEIASWLAGHGARHLILVSRSGSSGNTSRIAELEAQGVRVHILAVDLSIAGTESALRLEIDKLQVPDIKGVVHAAGIAGWHTLEACTPADIANVLAPKVRGTLNLAALFPPGTLDFFVLMSSVGQLVGFPGQMSYAPANAFLDGLATQRRQDGDNCTSIQWTSWSGVGMLAGSKSVTRMVTRGMNERGIAFISKEEALEAWEHVINLEADQVAVVRALKLDINEPLRHPILKNITPRRKTFNDYPEHAVAVVAMACRTAAGNTPDELWHLLQSGKSTVREIDAARFAEELATSTPATKGKLFGNFLPDVEQFDHRFFSKSKREAAALDPHQRLLLETTYQALEAAGWVGDEPESHDPTANRHTTSCFIGITAPEYFLNLASHPPSPYTGTGMLRSFNAGRLSHHFGWTGPAHTLDTACSSSMVAIHQACRALQLGECTRAVAGGVNLIPNLALSEAMRVGGFLSETGPCKTFDARADGYCRGEAVGVVALKPLHMALKDGDDIQGVLLATGNNQNINNTSITNPVLESQIVLYRDVLKRASVRPSDISYVEAHGTGTRAGDPVEVEGIRKVLGGSDRQSILHIGAVKPNVGHSEGAAGVISLIKVLLMMKHAKIPPQAHFETLNSNIPALEPDHMAIPTSLREWSDDLRLAMVNSYGASGNNAVAVVAPPPVQPSAGPVSASAWPIFISAASNSSLLAFCAKLDDHINKSSSNISLPQLAYTLAIKQNRQLPHILSTTATSLDNLQSQLRNPDRHIFVSQLPGNKPKPTILLFSGQNGNTTPSAKPLYETSLLFRMRLQQCEKVMHSLGLPSPIPAVLDGIESKGNGEEDADLVLRHATLFSIQYASGMAWIDSGVEPQAICGHSFGEWAALTVSGALTLEAGLKLVTGYVAFVSHCRASIIQRLWGADTGSMVAIEADLVATNTTPTQHLQPFLKEHPEAKLEIACYNGPNNYVVAGATKDIEVLATYLQDLKSQGPRSKLRYKVLRGMHAYHCHLADSIVDACAELSASIPFQTPTYPFISCHENDHESSGSWSGPGSNIIARNTRGPVYFGNAIQHIVARLGQSCTFLEAGFGGPIIAMAQNAVGKAEHTFVAVGATDPMRSLADATATLWKSSAVQFWPFHRSQREVFLTSQGQSVDLPPYQFEKHNHWLEYSKSSTNKQAALTESTTLCPHCNNSITDFPYIVQDAPALSDSVFNFSIDTRSSRFQELIGGHTVVGCPLCPAGMYLELVAHAVSLLHGANLAKEIVAESLEIKAPLGLDPQRSVKLALTRKTEDTWNFDFFSTAKGKINDRPTFHSTGTVCSRKRGEIEKDLEKWARMTELLDVDTDTEALRGALVYKVFASMAKYSTAYRGLRYLVGKGSEGAGEIVMPVDSKMSILSRTPNENIVDVPLLDNFFQVAGAFVHSLRNVSEEDEDVEMSNICTGMGFVGPLNGLQGSGKFRAYTNIVAESSKQTVLDLFAFDSLSNKMIWSARGLKFSKVPRNALVKVLAGATPGVLEVGQPKQQVSVPPTERVSPPKMSNQEDDILSGVQVVLSRSLDVPAAEVTRDALLEKLGTDSLVAPEILVALSEKFKVDISTNDFVAIEDVGALCDLISSRMHSDSASENDYKDDHGLESGSDAHSEEGLRRTISEILSKSLELEVTEIDMTSGLEDLGVDSLIAPEIIGSLNEAFGTEISSPEFASAIDVLSLCELVKGTIDQANDAIETPRTGASSPAREEQESAPKPRGSIGIGLMHEAFLQVRCGFDVHADDTGFKGYWDQVYQRQLRVVTSFIVEAFEKLGCPLKLSRPGQTLPAIQGALPKYQREVARLWEILAEADVVGKVADNYIRGPASLNDETQSPQEQSATLIADFPQYAPTHGLIDVLGPHLADCLTGQADPISLLFGSERGRLLLEDFYANAPGLRATTQVLCDFFSTAMHSSNGEPIHILEIGAGTGGTTKHLLPVLQATGLPFTYTFTDISDSLVARAKTTIFKDVTSMNFLRLDVEKEPPQELQGRYHVVLSSNCIHATHDARRSLANIRKLVRPENGCVALIEFTKKLPWYELIWGLLDGWWMFEDGREHALQTPWAWEQLLRDSGFAHVDWSEGSSRESRTLRVMVGFTAQDPGRPCPAKATSVLVHRGSGPANRNLYLFPDGRGYSTVFNDLGQVLAGTSLSLPVYGLNSPYTTQSTIDLEQEPLTLEEMAASYLAEVKRRQPSGRYLLGGYSFGGIIAYEVARQLIEAGDEVEKVVLLDTACPISDTSPANALAEYLFSVLPQDLIRKLKGDDSDEPFGLGITVARRQLKKYKVTRLPGSKVPQIIMVTAKHGMDPSKQDNPEERGLVLEPEEQWIANWFLNDRPNTPLGWEELVGSENVKIIMGDCNHFWMMTTIPAMKEWGVELAEALEA
ncbi:BcPKS20, polyketide synthase [Aspergillus carlsbadensis]|nr:BcPKS20, polyketide synthase [Aspergillus carlsbadensis]